ncbi:unnamed protein product [Parascedosporium putredinis]|uniref:Alpha/beta hydrolase n=1 Tax=Parascedosporium putredinis TaxID=1442378 RepID=A0A9P1H4M5_9PEZI|nr:unnamed protein product [Parascedosporium putredinis]CAI7996913.1 unnamed protein product [Parascedosporium putredinis]
MEANRAPAMFETDLVKQAGSKAQTHHYSKDAVAAAKEIKELFTVEGKNHFDLYDDLTETAPKLVSVFGKALA